MSSNTIANRDPEPEHRVAQRVLRAAVALLACRLLLALAVVPPWQQPDEPTHVAVVEMQRSRVSGLEASADPGREGEILQSMARYDWWEHRVSALEVPREIPRNFTSAGLRVAVPALDVTRPTSYYLVAGRIARWLPQWSVVEDLYFLRLVSMTLGMLTLWVAWLGARESLGALGGATVTMLLALHPQFALVSTSASPDLVANFCGACLWWQVAVAVTRQRPLWPLAATWVLAIGGTSADRMGLPLLALALLVSIVVLSMWAWRRAHRPTTWSALSTTGVTLAFLGVAAAIGLLGSTWTLTAFGESYGMGRIFSADWSPVPGAMTWSNFVRFTRLLHQSWWFSVGWGRYAAPEWWGAVAFGCTVVAWAGVAWRLLTRQSDARTHLLAALAIAGVAVQVFAVYWTYFRLGNGAQGRYLFPMLVPSLVLLWAGIDALVPPSRRVHAAAGLILIIAGLDVSAWILVTLPAYYASF